MKQRVKYRQKSPEKTTSISVTLNLFVWCSTEKNDIIKIFIENINEKYSLKIFIKDIIENTHRMALLLTYPSF